MNWLGDFVQNQLEADDEVLDLGCGIMQATLDVIPAYPKTRLRCKRLLGVDIHKPSLDFLKERGIETLQHDLTELPLPLPDKSFDVVLMTDLLEHLKMYQAEDLVNEAQRLARKKIICCTPKAFRRNEYATSIDYIGIGLNPYHRHQCLITEDWLKRFGFKIQEGHKTTWVAVRPAKLKILHVWSQAGVSSLMALHQRKRGHKADVLTNFGFDGLEIDKFYDINRVVNKPIVDTSTAKKIVYSPLPNKLKSIIRIANRKLRSARFYWRVIKKARAYDVIHIHSSSLSWFLTLFKPRLIEYHGSEIRKNPRKTSGIGYKIDRQLKKKFGISHRSDRGLMRLISRFTMLYYSTHDMIADLPNKSEWIPNPVDLEHFSRKNPFEAGTAFYTEQWYESSDRAKRIAREKGLHLTMLDRVGNKWVSYKDFPRFMEGFEYYIDRHRIPSLSKTGLEALAMGLKVIDWKGDIQERLPDIHDPEYVTDRTIEIYYSLIGE